MKENLNRLIFVIFCSISITSFADNSQIQNSSLDENDVISTNVEQVTVAFNNMLVADSVDWAYTREEFKEDEGTLERFDPNLDQPWNLLKVNGNNPDKSDLKSYNKKQTQHEKREHPSKFVAHKIAKPDSFKLINEKDDLASYRFELLPDEDDDMSQFLQGTLVLNQQNNQVVSLMLNNKEPFSPAFSVSIKSMELIFNFKAISENGPVFLAEIKQSIQGKMMGFKNISEKSIIRYTDFAQINPVLISE